MKILKKALIGLLAVGGIALAAVPASARPMAAPELTQVAAVPQAAGASATCHWRRGGWHRHRWGYRPYRRWHRWHRWGYHPYWRRPAYGFYRPYYGWHRPIYRPYYGWHHRRWHRWHRFY